MARRKKCKFGLRKDGKCRKTPKGRARKGCRYGRTKRGTCRKRRRRY